jgi:hypothetical protein
VVCMDFRDGLCEWAGHGPSPWLLIYWTMMQCAAGKGNMEPKMPLSDAAVCCRQWPTWGHCPAQVMLLENGT